jgi:hypothetical protein
MRGRWKITAVAASLAVATVAFAALATSAGQQPSRGPSKPIQGPLAASEQNAHLSSSVLTRYWLRHPETAPDELKPAITQLNASQGAEGAPPQAPTPTKSESGPQGAGPLAPSVAFNYRFNNETRGYPQNEESLTKCGTGVLGGTNDYHGFYTGDHDGTSWNYSNNSGASLLKMDYLRGITYNSIYLPSGGDPTAASFNPGSGCVFYAGSVAFGPGYADPSALLLYRATATTLAGSCTGDACWTQKLVRVVPNQSVEFLDKAWIAASPTSVIIVYTDFGSSSVSIKAQLCTATLSSCGAAYTVDGIAYPSNDYLQSPYVAYANGKFYVVWVYWQSLGSTSPYYYARIRGRVLTPTSTTSLTVGTARAIQTETRPVLQGDEILIDMWPRVATQAKTAVTSTGSRWFVVWDRCYAMPSTPYGECSDADVRLTYSNDGGVTWSTPTDIASTDGHEFFPSISVNGTAYAVIGYYTTDYGRLQDGFNSRYDVQLAYSTNASSSPPAWSYKRITSVPSNPYSDWWELSWGFVGDYIGVFTDPGAVYVHYNAEYTKLFPGSPDNIQVHQQDNYLAKVTYP